MTAVGIMLPLNGGDVDLVLYLYNKGVLLNAGGDALVEVGTSDYFEADVSEALVTTYQAVVFDGVGDAIYQGTLYAGETVVDQVPVAGAALGSHLGAAQRSVGSTTPIEFPWDAPDLETITGTLGDGTTAIEGEISFLRTEGGRHMYRITYNADDWPSGAGTLGYILTDGTTVRTLDLVVGEGSVSDEQIDEIATRSADAVVASADKQIVVRRRSPMHNRATNDLYLLQANDYLFVQGKHEEFETDLSGVAADYAVAVLVRGTDGNADVAFEGVGTLHDVDGSVWVRVEWPKEVLGIPGKFSWTTEVRTVAGDYVDSPIRGGMTIARNDHPSS